MERAGSEGTTRFAAPERRSDEVVAEHIRDVPQIRDELGVAEGLVEERLGLQGRLRAVAVVERVGDAAGVHGGTVAKAVDVRERIVGGPGLVQARHAA